MPPKVAAPIELGFVMASVFDLYRELAAPERAVSKKAARAVRNPPRKQRETVD